MNLRDTHRSDTVNEPILTQTMTFPKVEKEVFPSHCLQVFAHRAHVTAGVSPFYCRLFVY